MIAGAKLTAMAGLMTDIVVIIIVDVAAGQMRTLQGLRSNVPLDDRAAICFGIGDGPWLTKRFRFRLMK